MSRLRPGRRTAAILAILLLLAVAGSDLLIAGFWLGHPMLTAIVSALVVVVLSVAVIEVVLSRRSERRWRVLAQTALMELGEAANTTWRTLAGHLAERLADGNQILGRWAVALTASETYAEIFDHHVELYGRVGGLLQFLREGYRQTDPRGFRGRARREYSAPGGEADDEWFVDNLIGTINIGASLEDAPWDQALRILPQAWWDRRTVDLAAATRAARPVAAADR